MTENKNLLEELRSEELANKNSCKLREEWTDRICDEFDSCLDCRNATLKALADRIEKEFAPKAGNADIQKIIDKLEAIDESKPFAEALILGSGNDGISFHAHDKNHRALCDALGVDPLLGESFQRKLAAMRDRLVELLQQASQQNTVAATVNGFNWPCFKDGTPIQMGDKFVSQNGKVTPLTSIKLGGDWSELNACAIDKGRRWEIDGSDFQYVKRPSDDDTQERIDADAKLWPSDYCVKVFGWSWGKAAQTDMQEKVKAMAADLLRRQRELLQQ